MPASAGPSAATGCGRYEGGRSREARAPRPVGRQAGAAALVSPAGRLPEAPRCPILAPSSQRVAPGCSGGERSMGGLQSVLVPQYVFRVARTRVEEAFPDSETARAGVCGPFPDVARPLFAGCRAVSGCGRGRGTRVVGARDSARNTRAGERGVAEFRRGLCTRVLAVSASSSGASSLSGAVSARGHLKSTRFAPGSERRRSLSSGLALMASVGRAARTGRAAIGLSGRVGSWRW